MIFLTVGTQLPFDRLVSAMDQWAQKNRGVNVIAQIGQTSLKPKNFSATFSTMPGYEYERVFSEAELLVSHAGMGTIIKSLVSSKPVIVMPRLEVLGEHRNDHQVATVSRISDLKGCYVAKTSEKLIDFLDNRDSLDTGELSEVAPHSFIEELDKFLRA